MSHLLSLLVLLFLAVHVSHGSLLPPSYNDSMCSESFSCGDVEIRYPFYLSDATRASPDYTSSNYSCGYTDLKIVCQGEGKTKAPILYLGGDRYTILNIFYDNHTIIVRDTDVLRGNSCPGVAHNVSLGQEWLHYTDSFDSLAFFLDCYSTPGDDLPSDFPTKSYQINCGVFISNPPAVSFVFTSEEHNVSQKYQLADHCRQIFVVPVLEDSLLRGNPAVLSSQYGAVLKRGFELEWNKSTSPACHQCEQSGGRCSYSESRTFLGCLCSGGKVGDQDCHGTGDTTAYADSSSGDLSVYCYTTSMVGAAACGTPRFIFGGGVEAGGCSQGVILPAWMAT